MKLGTILIGGRLLAAIGAMLVLVACGGAQPSEGRLRLVLDFLPNPLHGGIYFAEDAGVFEAAGIDLAITAPTSTTDTLRMVAAGHAEIGLVPLMDFFQAVANGQDLVLIMALVDRPLAAVLVRAETGVLRPRDLEGRLVGLTGVPSDALTVAAMVRHDGGDPDRVRTVTIGFNAAQSLVAGSVDAAFGFWSYEGVMAGATVRLRPFLPQEHGIPHYPEIVAFARREWVEEQPRAAFAFREAVVAGYTAAREAGVEAALAPLAEVLEGESEEGLAPYWDILLPALPGCDGFAGELNAEQLQAYLDWIVAEGFLEVGRSARSMIVQPGRAGP